MLVIHTRINQSVLIGENGEVKVKLLSVTFDDNQQPIATLGFEADQKIPIAGEWNLRKGAKVPPPI